MNLNIEIPEINLDVVDPNLWVIQDRRSAVHTYANLYARIVDFVFRVVRRQIGSNPSPNVMGLALFKVLETARQIRVRMSMRTEGLYQYHADVAAMYHHRKVLRTFRTRYSRGVIMGTSLPNGMRLNMYVRQELRELDTLIDETNDDAEQAMVQERLHARAAA